jgi:hypothetical protein
MATSRPILSLYLKQSATVFWREVIFTATPSSSCVSTPKVRASPEKRKSRMGGQSTAGFHAFLSTASQTS